MFMERVLAMMRVVTSTTIDQTLKMRITAMWM